MNSTSRRRPPLPAEAPIHGRSHHQRRPTQAASRPIRALPDDLVVAPRRREKLSLKATTVTCRPAQPTQKNRIRGFFHAAALRARGADIRLYELERRVLVGRTT